jgi:hypothetical protein
LEEAGDKDAVQSLPEDRKASRKKDKGATNLRVVPQKSVLTITANVMLWIMDKS